LQQSRVMVLVFELMSNERGETIMVYRQVVNAESLSAALSLPPNFKNKRVEVTVRDIDDNKPLPTINRNELDAMMEGSIALSLLGALPPSDMTLDEIRAERLARYECTD